MSDDLIRRRDVIVTLKTLECLGYIKCKTEGAIKDIEAIPSADRTSATEIMNAYHEGVRKGIAEAYEAYGADRPQGEWKKHDGERDYCSRCKHIFKTRTITQQDKWTQYIDDLGYNFCPHCGAKMKGADDGN